MAKTSTICTGEASLRRIDIQRSQKVFFRSSDEQTLISVYRQTLAIKGELPTHAELLHRVDILRNQTTKTLIVLQAGGHFVAALYQNNECMRRCELILSEAFRLVIESIVL